MATSRSIGAWSRQRLATVLGIGLIAAITIFVGLGITLVQLVTAPSN